MRTKRHFYESGSLSTAFLVLIHLVVLITSLVIATLFADTVTALITLAVIGACLGLGLMICAVIRPRGTRALPVDRLYMPFYNDFQDE